MPPDSASPISRRRLGALPGADGTLFRTWAPEAASISVALESGPRVAMERLADGTFEARIADVEPGRRYRLVLNDDAAFPDPASRYQPEGVHGPSMVVDPRSFPWTDEGWGGIERRQLAFYELHVGTFTPAGTFEAARKRLPYVADLGVTAVELMPVADFPGRWNWGYDHAALFAPSRAYGEPDDLRRFVDTAHGHGLAVYLDVIYNHLGPDGAYVAAFAPMFTDRHDTPWGQAINLDDEHAEGVRALFIDNARMWLEEYHADGLRLDATHALVDDSETHFLRELKEAVEDISSGPPRLLVAEDHRNDHRLLQPRKAGGYQLDAVWADDFHHQIRNLTAGDEDGYYVDYAGSTTGDLAVTLNQGWFYDGRPSKYSGHPRGTDASPVHVDQCVICIQNHDQVGNRPTGRRLHHDIPLDLYRAVSAVLLLAPELPLLFMGQEWASSTPFQFFTDHDEPLGSRVSAGRREEFRSFKSFGGDVPDPQDPDTCRRSRLNWAEMNEEAHVGILNLYRDLLRLRRGLEGNASAAAAGPYALRLQRGAVELLVALREDISVAAGGGTRVVLHTEEKNYTAAGHPPVLDDRTVHFEAPAAIVLTS